MVGEAAALDMSNVGYLIGLVAVIYGGCYLAYEQYKKHFGKKPTTRRNTVKNGPLVKVMPNRKPVLNSETGGKLPVSKTETGLAVTQPKPIYVPTPEDLARGNIVPNKPKSQRELLQEAIKRREVRALPYYWQAWASKGHDLKMDMWWFELIAGLMNDDIPHVMVVGRTRSGKTLLTMALLVELSRLGRVVILDPHASPHWGMPAVGLMRNFPALKVAYKVILYELEIRSRQYATGEKKTVDFEQLYVVMDELPAQNTHLKDDMQIFMKTMIREAAKYGIHLIILTQSDRVETMGIKGEGDMRNALYTIYLQDAAIERLPDMATAFDKARPIVIDWNGQCYPVARKFIPWLAQYPKVVSSEWKIRNLPEPPPLSASELARMIAEDHANGDAPYDEEEEKLIAHQRRYEAPGAAQVFYPPHTTPEGLNRQSAPQQPQIQSHEELAQPVTDGTVDHYATVAKLLKENPEVSAFTVAKTLWPESGGRGRKHGEAKTLIEQVKAVMAVSQTVSKEVSQPVSVSVSGTVSGVSGSALSSNGATKPPF